MQKRHSPPSTFHLPLFTVRGYTLLELLVVIGVVAILSGTAFLNLIGYEARRDLESTSKRVAALFYDARARSMTQESGGAWGVLVRAAAPFQFQLVQRAGSSGCTLTGIPSSAVVLNARFTLSPLSPTGYTTSICFEPLTGFLTASATPEPVIITIDLASGGGTPALIRIYNNGRIE